MTDPSPRAAAPDLSRWPADPAELVDTTRCPACFSTLTSTRCRVCSLDLGVPEAADLLERSTALYRWQLARQELIGRMRAAQAAREEVQVEPAHIAAVETTVSVRMSRPVSVSASVPMPEPVRDSGPLRVHEPVGPTSATSSTTRSGPPQSPAVPAAPAAEGPGGRSGVQVLLLTLGVVLISITAIVFLFVAYLVASLEVRSVIIAAGSIAVLGVAWLLRARRLPGTAEGVATVAIVLLLLDVWIVRANDLFGSSQLTTSAYSGVAIAVVAGLLAGTRAATGIRVTGYAAAGLTPIAAFLLGFAIDPGTATGVWLGGMAASIGGSMAAARRPSIGRSVLLTAGFVGAGASMIEAPWALPDVAWGASWAFGAVGGVWLLALAMLAVRERDGASMWAWIGASAFGASIALAPAVGALQELESADAVWVAPLGAGAATWVLAGAARALPRRREWFAGFLGAATVAVVASGLGLLSGLVAVGARVISGFDPWTLEGDSALPTIVSDGALGAVLVPLIVAAGSAAALLTLGRLRRFAAIPVSALVTAGIVAGSLAPTVWLAAAALTAIAAVTLAAAAVRERITFPGSLAVLSIGGIAAGLVAWSTAHSSSDVWPWTVAALVALLIAGRVVAARVWPYDLVRGVGAAHVALAAVLACTVAFSIPLWLEGAGSAAAGPWASPWMWLGTVASVLLAVGLFTPSLRALDRATLALPLLAAVLAGALVAAFDGGASLDWLPATAGAIVTVVGLRRAGSRALTVALASAAPLLLALATAAGVAEVRGGPAFAVGAAAGVLLAAAIGHAAVPRAAAGARLAWSVAVGLGAMSVLLPSSTAGDELWLLLALLAPVPVLVAALHADPIGGDAPSRHLSWISLPLAVGAVWAWLAGDGVDDVEAYTVPLAIMLAATAALITWRRTAASVRSSGRTALFASAAAVLVLPSVASTADSELRTLILVASGTVVAIAAVFLPQAARGVPIRLLGVGTGGVALVGGALVRGSAVALGEPSTLPTEFWPLLALAAGVVVATMWYRTASQPGELAEAMVAASVVAVSIPTLLAIIVGDAPTLRAAVLFPALAVGYVVVVFGRWRPFAGPLVDWSTLGVLVLGGIAVLVSRQVEPFDVVTASIAVALLGAGVVRMRRDAALGSWPALGIGLAVLLLPALAADLVEPELWRLIALGVASAAAVVIGAVRRLQAPLLFGGAVLLVHAVAQLWPWITLVYEAVWWWLWLGVAGVALVALAATYERQLRLARNVVRSIAELR
jgi:hypothetical protein